MIWFFNRKNLFPASDFRLPHLRDCEELRKFAIFNISHHRLSVFGLKVKEPMTWLEAQFFFPFFVSKYEVASACPSSLIPRSLIGCHWIPSATHEPGIMIELCGVVWNSNLIRCYFWKSFFWEPSRSTCVFFIFFLQLHYGTIRSEFRMQVFRCTQVFPHLAKWIYFLPLTSESLLWRPSCHTFLWLRIRSRNFQQPLSSHSSATTCLGNHSGFLAPSMMLSPSVKTISEYALALNVFIFNPNSFEWMFGVCALLKEIPFYRVMRGVNK